MKFCEVSRILILNLTWKFHLSILKNKKVLFLKEKYFLSRTAKIHPKDGVSRFNFPEGFGGAWGIGCGKSKEIVPGVYAAVTRWFHPYLFLFDFPFIYIPIKFNSKFNYRRSLISAVLISTILDSMWFLILSYFPPL